MHWECLSTRRCARPERFRRGCCADPDAGRLGIGLPADIVVLDDGLEVERVLVGGETRVAC